MNHSSIVRSIVALAGFCSALSPALSAAQTSQTAAVNPSSDGAHPRTAEIPSSIDAPIAADHLVHAFHNRSSLHRVALLEQIDSSAAIPPEAAVSLLQDALHDEDPLVREAALSALLRRDTTQTPVLSEAEVDAFQSENAELAKVHFATKNADTVKLKDLLQHGDAVVQESAFEALATTDLPGAIEALHAELRNTASVYRLQTLQLLTRSTYTNSSNELLAILQEMGEDPDPLVRDFARQTLKDKQKDADGERAK